MNPHELALERKPETFELYETPHTIQAVYQSAKTLPHQIPTESHLFFPVRRPHLGSAFALLEVGAQDFLAIG